MKANMHEVDTMTIARTVRKDKTNTNLNCVVPEFFSSCRMKRNVDLITRNQFLVFSIYKRIPIFNRVNHVRPCSFMTNQSIRRWAVSLLNADFYWWVIFFPFFSSLHFGFCFLFPAATAIVKSFPAPLEDARSNDPNRRARYLRNLRPVSDQRRRRKKTRFSSAEKLDARSAVCAGRAIVGCASLAEPRKQ